MRHNKKIEAQDYKISHHWTKQVGFDGKVLGIWKKSHVWMDSVRLYIKKTM